METRSASIDELPHGLVFQASGFDQGRAVQPVLESMMEGVISSAARCGLHPRHQWRFLSVCFLRGVLKGLYACHVIPADFFPCTNQEHRHCPR